MTEFTHVLSQLVKVSQVDVNPDLRAVIKVNFEGQEYIIFGSRHKIIYIYSYHPETNDIKLENSFEAHGHYINCLTYIYPNDQYPTGALVTGSRDKTIKIWEFKTILQQSSTPILPIQTYLHDDQVYYLTTTFEGTPIHIISCSYDFTCRIWSSNPSENLILRHENSLILGAASIPGGYVTCGLDETIRIWNYKGECVVSLIGAHEDPIRGCLYNPRQKILTTIDSSGSIFEWSINGLSIEFLSVIRATNSCLYSIALLDEDHYVASCSNHCAYVVSMKTKKVVDVLFTSSHVWSVCSLSNKDIVCAGSDGLCHIFTNDQNRRCDEETEKKYFANLEKVDFITLKELNPSDVPSIDSLNQEKMDIETTHVVRDGDRFSVLIWSKDYKKWVSIGGYKIPEEKSKMIGVTDDEENHLVFNTSYNIEDDDCIPSRINRNIFPIKKLCYFKDKVSDQTLDDLFKIEGLNDTSLKNHISLANFETIQKILMNSEENNKLIEPLLDILRERILDDDARSFILPKNLVTIVKKLIQVDVKNVDEVFIHLLLCIITNMFLNYTGEILNDINVYDILDKFSIRFGGFNSMTQLSFATVLFNYSTILSFNREMCVKIVDLIFRVVIPKINSVALLRLLYACGNVALFWKDAKEEVEKHRNDINKIESFDVSDHCKTTLSYIIMLLK